MGPAVEIALRRAVGAAHVLTDPEMKAGYETDWTGQYRGAARAVVRPRTTEEAAECVRICYEAAVPIVPQGGNTGLVGGSVPDGSGRAVVLSTARLAEVGTVDRAAAQVTVGAGVPLAVAQAHAHRIGMAVAVDLGARDSATIGGMVATNAGGIQVLRYGTMRRQVAGLEAVLGTGAVVSHLRGLEKDNTGYDLASLLCGSEGTLGVITAVRLRLVPLAAHRATALLAWADAAGMVAGLAPLRAVRGLQAAEFFLRAGMELVLDHHRLADPFSRPYPAYLLVEAAGPEDPTDALADAVGHVPGVLDVAVATDEVTRARLWALRELHTEALAAAGPPRKFDVTIPAPAIVRFLDEVAGAVAGVAGPGARCHHFGHLGDGNIHVNVLGLEALDAEALDDLDLSVLTLVAEHGGSISAEHGIGRLKLRWLPLARSRAELAAFRAIKQGLDPNWIFNPGVLLDSAPP